MRARAIKSKRLSGFKRIHQAKIRVRVAQIRAHASGKRYHNFCLVKLIDPEVLRRPLNLSHAKIPEGDED